MNEEQKEGYNDLANEVYRVSKEVEKIGKEYFGDVKKAREAGNSKPDTRPFLRG